MPRGETKEAPRALLYTSRRGQMKKGDRLAVSPREMKRRPVATLQFANRAESNRERNKTRVRCSIASGSHAICALFITN